MTKIFMSAVGCVTLGMVCCGPVFAQSVCKDEILIAGRAGLSRETAASKAVADWKNQANIKYGTFHSNPEKAERLDGVKGLDTTHCAKTIVGFFVCEARGRPCPDNQADLTANPLPISGSSCTSDDPLGCRSDVKWLQDRLNDKGARLRVDGVKGSETNAAIRWYKQRHQLGYDSSIDQRLVDSLKA